MVFVIVVLLQYFQLKESEQSIAKKVTWYERN